MIETTLHIKKGTITNWQAFKTVISLPDGGYGVVIKRLGKRSNQLNKYYWSCVIQYQKEGFKNIGYDLSKEQIHDFNKAEFDYTEIVNEKTGEAKRIPGSTKVMTNIQMIEFIDRIKLFAAEWLNQYIPDPNKQSEIWDCSYEASYDSETNSTIVKK